MRQREYQETHPWLTFRVDMSKADPEIWMLLGEAQSKCFHIAGVPLMPDVAREFHNLYLTKGVLATTAIEGNTLTEEEVRRRIDGKLELPPSREYLGREVDNIVAACNGIAEGMDEHRPLSVQEINAFNARVMEGLEMTDGAPGAIRLHGVGVARYRGAPAQDCEYLLERLIEMLTAMKTIDRREVVVGLLKAIIAHVYFVWIHPFSDGNGRTARLIELKLLIESGVPMPAAHLLSNHYNLTRERYYRELDKTSRGEYDIMGFIRYALQGFVDGAREQLHKIRLIQWDLCWRNFIYDRFKNKNTSAMLRRRHLILDLSGLEHGRFEGSRIRSISPRIATHYANKGEKTITRDINYLLDQDLIVKEGKQYSVNRSQILAFLPKSAIGIKRLFE